MKVKAKANIKYDGVWHRPGDVFDIQDEAFHAIKGSAEQVEENHTPVFEQNAATEIKPASTRKRAKTKE